MGRIATSMRALSIAFAALAASSAAPAQKYDPVQRFNPAQDVGIDQNLGAQVPLDLVFRDEAAREVKLGEYLGDRPIVLSFVYYQCPMLCTEVLNEQVRMLKALTLDIGRDFQVVTVSIDPTETPSLAASKKAAYVEQLGKPEAEHAWHFLTGDQAAIAKLTSVAGFRYTWDEEQQQYAHAGGLIVVTPQGVISHYLYGIEYAARDVRLALVEAAAGTIGSFVDQVLMLCFQYDPKVGQYTFVVMSVIRVIGTLCVLVGAFFVVRWLRRESRGSSIDAKIAGTESR